MTPPPIRREIVQRRTSGRGIPIVPAVRAPWLVRHGPSLRLATWIALVLIAIRLVAPRPEGWRRWRDASDALKDVEAARTAALIAYQAASRAWPAPGPFGQAPQALLPYLPSQGSFSRPRYRLAWEFAADSTSGARLIGVSVVGGDPTLAVTMAKRAPVGMSVVVSNGRFTTLISSAIGQ